jgi:hypothetical protein
MFICERWGLNRPRFTTGVESTLPSSPAEK